MAIKRQPDVLKFSPEDPTPDLGLGLVALSERGDLAWTQRHAQDPAGVGPVWLSEAGTCARKLSYRLLGYVPTPMDDAGRHIVQLGNIIHDAIQGLWPAETVEVSVQVVDADGDVWMVGRTDLIAGEAEVVDFKSIAAYGFVQKQGNEGPDMAHVLQIALAMLALNLPLGRLVYIAKERMTVRDARKLGLEEDSPRRFAVEFPFELDYVREITERESDRLHRVWEMALEDRKAPRAIPYSMPAGARVSDPKSGAWARWELGPQGDAVLVETGSVWNCGYCSMQAHCVADMELESMGSTPVAIEPKGT